MGERIIPKEKFWKIVKASKRPIVEILASVTITSEGIIDKNGVTFDCLSDATKQFVRGSRERHNKGTNKLYKQVLSGDKESTRYNLQLQASLYSEKLTEEDRKRFEEDTDWKNATNDKVYAWIQEIFKVVR